MGYAIKIFVPRPLHYFTSSPGCITGTTGDHCLRGSLPTTSLTFYFKLPYIDRFSVIIRKKIVMIWVSDYFFFLSRSATCLAWKTYAIADSVHVWFISLHIQAAISVTSARRSGICPFVWENIYPVMRPLKFSNVSRILNIFASYVEQIVSMYRVTPSVVSNLG